MIGDSGLVGLESKSSEREGGCLGLVALKERVGGCSALVTLLEERVEVCLPLIALLEEMLRTCFPLVALPEEVSCWKRRWGVDRKLQAVHFTELHWWRIAC